VLEREKVFSTAVFARSGHRNCRRYTSVAFLRNAEQSSADGNRDPL
jgi:hypothetical protein